MKSIDLRVPGDSDKELSVSRVRKHSQKLTAYLHFQNFLFQKTFIRQEGPISGLVDNPD